MVSGQRTCMACPGKATTAAPVAQGGKSTNAAPQQSPSNQQSPSEQQSSSGQSLSDQLSAAQPTSNPVVPTSIPSSSGAPTQVSSRSVNTAAQQSSSLSATSDTTMIPGASGTAVSSTTLVSATSSTPTGAIAGGIIGGLVLLALIAALFWWRQRRRSAAKPLNLEASPFQDELTSGTSPIPVKYVSEKSNQGGWGPVSLGTGSSSALPTNASPSLSGSTPAAHSSDIEGTDDSEARLLALREQVDREIASRRAMRGSIVTEAPPSYFGERS